MLDGLRTLMDKDVATKCWLHEEVASAYDAHKAGPDRAEPLINAIAIVRAHIAANRTH